MANILYGVSGEGSGHSSRSKEILTHLAKQHNVHVITYGKAYPYLKQYFPTTEIYGLHLDFQDNKIRYLGTLQKNIQNLVMSGQKFKQLRQLLKTFKPDVIITDFEPTSFYLSKIYGVPLISLDNQHRITNLNLTIPKQFKKDYALCKFIIKLMIPSADYYLITSFFKEKIFTKKTYLFAPILRQEVRKLKPTQGKHILVYQTSPTNTQMLAILRQIPAQFIVYGFNKNSKEGNLVFKQFSTEGFLRDLATSRGVITNGGFTLITEALHLRKPILSEPIQGQFEQIINAYYLDKLGYGKYIERITKKNVLDFLQYIPTYCNNLKRYKAKDTKDLVKKLHALIKKNLTKPI